MNLSQGVLLVFVVAFLSACASIKPPYDNSRELFAISEKSAHEVYAAGSSFSGDGSTLVFLGGGRWEEWSSSCTDTNLVAHGTYTRKKGRITLYEKGKPPVVFYSYRYDHRKYLVTLEQLRILKDGPDEAALHDFFKKSAR